MVQIAKETNTRHIEKDNFGKGKSMLITDTTFLEQSLLFYQSFLMGKFWPLLFWENFENSTTTPPHPRFYKGRNPLMKTALKKTAFCHREFLEKIVLDSCKTSNLLKPNHEFLFYD